MLISQESLGKLGIPASQGFFAWDFEPWIFLESYSHDGRRRSNEI